MTVTLTIKQVPEPLAKQLKRRAERNRRSLQGELLCIIEAAAKERASTVAEPAASSYSALRAQPRPHASKRAPRKAGSHTPDAAASTAYADPDARTLAGRLRGRATARLSTDEIMRLTRGA